MANPFSNKKKIRGWKRKIKQIEQWKLRFLNLDIEQLNFNQRDYVKLWITPFYKLVRRNPPLWFSRMLLEAMIEVYHSWYRILSQLNEPFYLKIWLYHPNFINSQIVVAIRDCLNYYDEVFDKSNEEKKFPCEVFGKKELLMQFSWELYIDSKEYWFSEFQEDLQLGLKTVRQVEALKRKAYKSETVDLTYGKDQLYRIKVGDVWIGQSMMTQKFKDDNQTFLCNNLT
ncbi:hypothetical protein [Brevibacillus panacihumi]|uniref:hypothetical protein n=1 Tax=Brevibacillus panacihumi TaxID=497735 RepID=UPI0016068E33|nr:hypothetical protein [Brevibacillus panacihumi]